MPTDVPPSEVPDRPIARRALLLSLGCGFIYLLIAGGFRFWFEQTEFAHHILMADAMLHGQFHIRQEAIRPMLRRGTETGQVYLQQRERELGKKLTPSERDMYLRSWIHYRTIQDWTIIDGKLYGYWAPLAPVLMIPFVALFGAGASDTLINALFGALNIGLFYWLLRRADRLGLCPMSEALGVALTLLFAFGTVHFYLACAGRVWFAAQIVTLTAILAAMIAATSPRSGVRPVLASGACFGAAILGRNVVALTLPFFLVLLWIRAKDAGGGRFKAFLLRAAAFTLPCAVAVVAQLAYNRARFGSLFDDGLVAQIQTAGDPRFRSDYDQYGLFNIHYLARNTYYYFENWNLTTTPDGRTNFDPQGNSLFLVTPPLLYVLLAWRRRSGFTLALVGAVAPMMAALLLYLATGYYQFGNRYLLEIMPFLLLLAACGMRGKLTMVGYALIVLAVTANLFGTYRFCEQSFAPLRPWISVWLLPAFAGAAMLAWPIVRRRLPGDPARA